VQQARECKVIAILAFAWDKACGFVSETGITQPREFGFTLCRCFNWRVHISLLIRLSPILFVVT
jgi:hypothetical protein